jgi:hypothetical protein
MNLSAGLMTILGLAASFAPQEILSAAGADSEGLPVLLVQITGGLYLGFAMLNWMARGVLIGGIQTPWGQQKRVIPKHRGVQKNRVKVVAVVNRTAPMNDRRCDHPQMFLSTCRCPPAGPS